MEFEPLGDRVLIGFTEEDGKTAGGIYIPDSAKEKSSKGKVEATGDRVRHLKPGYEVFIDQYSGTKITIEGIEYLIIKEKDILGIFSKEEK